VEGPDHLKWPSFDISRKILCEDPSGVGEIPLHWARRCAYRVSLLRGWMRNAWVGLDDERVGPLTDWILACAIARENCLLLGLPGVAKSEIASQFFKWLGLTTPQVGDEKLKSLAASNVFDGAWWTERRNEERKQQKYFHYLLSRFSQVEEIFGPIEMELLKKGIMARVNFGLLTGPGVRAAFLDEVFKSSSAVLNTLLTLTQERTYFNWGGMVPSDLVMFIGASNEMPGGFATGTVGQGGGGDDFQMLHAFLDRFPLRLSIPTASASRSDGAVEKSDLALATDIALDREEAKFTTGRAFRTPEEREIDRPCINDLLLLGRCCLQGLRARQPLLFTPEKLNKFYTHFMTIGGNLQALSGASSGLMERDTITWTISPRKLRSLFKIGLALSLVRDDKFSDPNGPAGANLRPDSLRVFDLIWDTPGELTNLLRANKPLIQRAETPDKEWRP
jgi:hypothetical protein